MSAAAPADAIFDTEILDGPPIPHCAIALSILWTVPPLLFWLFDVLTRKRKRVVLTGVDPYLFETDRDTEDSACIDRRLVCMLASLEHSLPHHPKARAIAGGLGKVVDLIARHHPTDIIMVHPMIASGDKVSYGEPTSEDKPLKILVDGQKMTVRVFRHTSYPNGSEGVKVDFLMLSHAMFESRTKESVYPNPMTRRKVLQFFSLWNQAVGALILRYRPHVYHLPDFHTAVAPLYALPKYPTLRVLLVLHNAEYQGSISTDMVFPNSTEVQQLGTIWNLPEEKVLNYLVQDGRFNMLKAAVKFIMDNQDGVGVCAVSQYYAEECYSGYSMLWALPYIDGLDNPMLDEERTVMGMNETLRDKKRNAKRAMQREFGLIEDDDARIFVSLGRLVRQKGVDVIADVAPWILRNFEKAQVLIIGPIGDGFGHYAAKKLEALAADERYKGRVFIKCEFMRVPEELKFAADFCLMPSRDEPFGYVDIEFAWRGALLVGAQAGGLGKVPGFYYVAQNKENLGRLRSELENVIRKAMEVPREQLDRMSDEALKCDFPLKLWQRKLLALYRKALKAKSGSLPSENEVEIPDEVELTHRESFINHNPEIRVVNTDCGGSFDVTPSDDFPNQTSAKPPFEPPTRVLSNFGVRVPEKHVQPMYSGAPNTFDPWEAGPTSAITFGQFMTAPVSMIDEMTMTENLPKKRQTLFADIRNQLSESLGRTKSLASDDDFGEFFTQELPEEEIAIRVQQKLDKDPTLSIDEILEMIGSEVDIEREHSAMWRHAASPITTWMLKLTHGVSNVHWCVIVGYLGIPVVEHLTYVIASELAIRGNTNFPEWFMAFPWFKRVFGLGGLDAPLIHIILFSTNCTGLCCGTPIWVLLSKCVPPRTLMSISLFLQALIPFFIFPTKPTVMKAVTFTFFHALFSSSGLLFIVFNFMMSIKGDMSQAAIRMGLLELPRICIKQFLQMYIILASPASLPSVKDSTPTGLAWSLAPISVVGFLMTAVPGFLLLFAPGPYRNDRLPSWDLAVIAKRKSFMIFGVSDIVGALTLYPSGAYTMWWMANGWHSSSDLLWVTFFSFLFLVVGFSIWSYALYLASRTGFSFLIGFSLLLPPAAILRAVTVSEISTFTNMGRSNLGIVVSVTSLLMEGMRASAMWTAKIKILNSRWRLLSYGTIFITLTQFFSIFSPFICEGIARVFSATFISRNQRELADAIVVTVIPLGVMQFSIQVMAAFFIRRDMVIATKAERADASNSLFMRLFRKFPLLFSFAIALVVGTVVGSFFLQISNSALEYNAVNRCRVAAPPSSCTFLLTAKHQEPPPGSAEDYYWNASFKRNQYGSVSTGRYNCAKRTRQDDGDTFVYDPDAGECHIYKCYSPRNIDIVSPLEQMKDREVWSKHCMMSGQNLVAVHLFEWRWDDIAVECKEYLGPAGFNMIQITPPAEHTLGYSWSVRYRPASYKLESRSGTREEFIKMVQECREAGVDIMVDAVINHMAPPTGYSQHCGGTVESAIDVERPVCGTGWNGTVYGNREYLNNTEGVDLYRKKHFHHYQGNVHSNCGLPPWTNNRHTCDLFGLPDLDTEGKETQRMIQHYLWDLYQIGVSMLRVDAALNIYPASLARILEPFPWNYIVQEYYPGVFFYEKGTLQRAMTIGSITDFVYGQRVANSLFSARKLGSHDEEKFAWESRDEHFGELLELKDGPLRDMHYIVSRSPVPETHQLIFLDNHDQQRERWKAEHGPLLPENGQCWWESPDIRSCRPTWMNGYEYNLAQLYMLAWPYGDAVRISSSYLWSEYNQGPPGIGIQNENDTKIHGEHLRPRRVHNTEGFQCRPMPTDTPASRDYVEQSRDRQWLCEHRWQGVAGLIRLRKLVGRSHPVRDTYKESGRFCYSLGEVAFVAFNKGYNWFTKTGRNETWDLSGRETGLPDGLYCNLAGTVSIDGGEGSIPYIPPPERWHQECGNLDVLEVRNGKIAVGRVSYAGKGDGGIVALHVAYKSKAKSQNAIVV